MARLLAILKALFLAFEREQKSILSIAGNNFFIVTALFLQKSAGALYLLIGVVLLFPLSTDPLRKVPPSRMATWPLSTGERRTLRVVSPGLNPLTWAIVALLIWGVRGKVTWGLCALAAGMVAAGFFLSSAVTGHSGRLRGVPHFPGLLDQLFRKNLRELLATLDVYCALVLSLAAGGWRLSRLAFPVEAQLAMTILIVLALSSYAQCLFGFEGDAGLRRYRLLPLRGRQILAAKDAVFLLAAIVLSLPAAPLAGTGAALIAIAMGHAPSVEHVRVQTRWRFCTGSSVGFGLVQAVALTLASSGIFLKSGWFFVPCVAVWAGSLLFYGRELERVPEPAQTE